MTDRRRALISAALALGAVAFAATQMERWARAAHAAAALRRPEPRFAPASASAPRRDMPALISDAATPAGVRQVVSVSGGAGATRETEVEWDGDLAASLRFLSRVRAAGSAVARVSLTSTDESPGLLHGRAALVPVVRRSTDTVATIRRDPFSPRWSTTVRFARLASQNRRAEEERQRRDTERADAERRAREEADRRAAAQRDFTARYALTGVVTDTRGALAFLTVDRQRSVLARAGDRVDGATVTAIDGARGEATLTGADAMTVVLHVGGAP